MTHNPKEIFDAVTTVYNLAIFANADTDLLDSLKTSVGIAKSKLIVPKKTADARRKPVIVENTRFASIRDAARYLVGPRKNFTTTIAYNRAVMSKSVMISYRCSKTAVPGYRWA